MKSLNRVLKTALALAVVGTIGCTDKNKSNNSIDINGIVNQQNLSKTDKAEQLALAAEQLITGDSFMYADEVASTALSVDPKNKRAQLIKALVGPAMATKGLLARVKPIVTRTEKSLAEYNEVIEGLSQDPHKALKTFFLDGQPDIKTEKDAQAFVDQVNSAFQRMRMFFKENKDLKITVHSQTDLTDSRASQKQQEQCYWQVDEATSMYNEICPPGFENKIREMYHVDIARADIEILQQVTAGFQMYLTLMNAYSVSGVIAVNEKYKDGIENKKTYINELLKDSSFATLRSAKHLKMVSDMGLDFVSGVRWADKLKSELCPNGNQDNYYGDAEPVRPGYLLKWGVCFNSEAKDVDGTYKPLETVLQTAELALGGSSLSIVARGQNGEKATSVVPAKFLAGAVKDVRSLQPTFNKCGRVIAVGDSSLAGILPNKDANDLIDLGSTACWQD